MTLNPLKWKARSFLYMVIWFIFIYASFIYTRYRIVNLEFYIPTAQPKVVWEFVADFSNVKKLNPTIQDFNIIEESGNLDHWKYTVEYTENLSHWPYLKNTGRGYYSVRPEKDGYLILSKHKTCFFEGYFCLETSSQFRFIPYSTGTKCQEEIQYECPIAFTVPCQREVLYQRQEIMNRMQEHFRPK